MMNYAKKMPFPAKKKPMPMSKDSDMAVELEVESEGEEAPVDLKSMMAEGSEAEGGEGSPLADIPDEELMAEMKKRGLMPEEAAAPEAAKPPMMK